MNAPKYNLRGSIAINLSICRNDFDNAKLITESILKSEPLHHVELVLSLAGGEEAIKEVTGEHVWLDFVNSLRGHFKTIRLNKCSDVRPDPTTPTDGRDWRPNNKMFRNVADYFSTYMTHVGAFLFLEPDMTILDYAWWSKLTSEYLKGGQPFMGHVSQVYTSKNGVSIPAHMNGGGFYPNPVGMYSPILLAIGNNRHRHSAPFDIGAGGEITPRCHATPLIYVDFGTCKPRKDTILFHGDKDGSLKRKYLKEPVKASAHSAPADSLAPTQLVNPVDVYLASLRQVGHHDSAWQEAVRQFQAEHAKELLVPQKRRKSRTAAVHSNEWTKV